MPVKEVPVPTGEDAVQEAIEDILEAPIREVAPEPKADKEDDSWTKVVPKPKSRVSRAKKEEPPKVDLKQRMPCPICKKMYTLHSLLYTHQCTKDAREAKQKRPSSGQSSSTLIIEKPLPDVSPAEPIIASFGEDLPQAPAAEHTQEAPPEPPVRQPAQMSYREALLQRRLAIEARQREIHTTPIRNYFGRSY